MQDAGYATPGTLEQLHRAFEERLHGLSAELQRCVDKLPADPVLLQLARDSDSAVHISVRVAEVITDSLRREQEATTRRALRRAATAEAELKTARRQVRGELGEVLDVLKKWDQKEPDAAGPAHKPGEPHDGALREAEGKIAKLKRQRDSLRETVAELRKRAEKAADAHAPGCSEAQLLRQTVRDNQCLIAEVANLQTERDAQADKHQVLADRVQDIVTEAREAQRCAERKCKEAEAKTAETAQQVADLQRQLAESRKDVTLRLAVDEEREHILRELASQRHDADRHSEALASALETSRAKLKSTARQLSDLKLKDAVHSKMNSILKSSTHSVNASVVEPLPQQATEHLASVAAACKTTIEALENRNQELSRQLQLVTDQARADLSDLADHLKKTNARRVQAEEASVHHRIRCIDLEKQLAVLEERGKHLAHAAAEPQQQQQQQQQRRPPEADENPPPRDSSAVADVSLFRELLLACDGDVGAVRKVLDVLPAVSSAPAAPPPAGGGPAPAATLRDVIAEVLAAVGRPSAKDPGRARVDAARGRVDHLRRRIQGLDASGADPSFATGDGRSAGAIEDEIAALRDEYELLLNEHLAVCHDSSAGGKPDNGRALHAQVAGLQAELAEAHASLEASRRCEESLRCDLDTAGGLVEALKTELQSVQAAQGKTQHACKARIDDLTARGDRLRAALDEKQAEVARLQDTLQMTEAALAAEQGNCRKREARLHAVLTEKEAEEGARQKDYKAWMAEHKELVELRVRVQFLSEAETDWSATTRALHESEARERKLNEQVELLSSSVDARNQTVQDLTRRLSACEAATLQATARAETSHDHHRDLTCQLAAAAEKAAAQQQALAEAHAQLRAAAAEKRDALQALAAAESRAEDLQERLSAAAAELAEKHRGGQAEIQALVDQRDGMVDRAVYTRVEEDAKALRRENEGLTKRVAALGNEAMREQRGRVDAEADIREAKRLVHDLRETLAQKEAALRECEAAYRTDSWADGDSTAMPRNPDRELTAAHARIADLEHRNNDLAAQLHLRAVATASPALTVVRTEDARRQSVASPLPEAAASWGGDKHGQVNSPPRVGGYLSSSSPTTASPPTQQTHRNDSSAHTSGRRGRAADHASSAETEKMKQQLLIDLREQMSQSGGEGGDALVSSFRSVDTEGGPLGGSLSSAVRKASEVSLLKRAFEADDHAHLQQHVQQHLLRPGGAAAVNEILELSSIGHVLGRKSESPSSVSFSMNSARHSPEADVNAGYPTSNAASFQDDASNHSVLQTTASYTR
eukprot:gene15717-24003_t